MPTIKFCGAAQTVTGSSHLVTLADGFSILLDCGMFQGHDSNYGEENKDFLFAPDKLNCLVLSHAHIDHCGRIPRLVAQGFSSAIYCTPATRDLAEVMLMDSAHIQEKDTEFNNKRRLRKGLDEMEILYTTDDVKKTIPLFRKKNYEEWFQIHPGCEVMFRDNGHILGSASVHLRIFENGKQIMLGFSGDIGRPDRPILHDPVQMEPCDFLLSESTYGGRKHEAFPDDKEHLLKVVFDTCVTRKGKVIIPAFSVGRTQEIVYMLDQLWDTEQLPRVPVYVDSPLSTNATAIYRKHPECFDADILHHLETDPDPFGFNSLNYITEVEESKALNSKPEPCIIISASGMAEAGRILHHIKNNTEDARNTILIVGYCAEHSLGARLRNGEKNLKIFGDEITVRAQVAIMDSFSAHGDHDELISFLSNQTGVKKLFLVHGDIKAMNALAAGLKPKGFLSIEMPVKGRVVKL